MRVLVSRTASPIGEVLVATADDVVLALDFGDAARRVETRVRGRFGPNPSLEPAAEGPIDARIRAYFAGDLRAFDGVRFETGGTPFQRRVWAALVQIPPGQVRSYAGIAAAIGHGSAARAVGLASGRNPIGLIIPCHRVIGSDGALTGYSGGLGRKRWLLEHERRPISGERVLMSGAAE